ncbi:cryptochrome/photolyase family protein [Halioxenophilus sp. WMMB6]|uniref:cryptochrome/photolyase family protein n=1 Tax=Halioxenophilus sp. WMMB6 TaxID=3073815 RepID=UPI00295E9AC9|nr:FAD-binding domain-containing protein [Halioxenophilus sp. WMMB6]
MANSRQLVWLRSDLRLADNPALFRAHQAGAVIACFALTPGQWRAHHDSPAKLGLAHDLLSHLAEALAARNIPLKIISVPDYAQLPKALVALAAELGAEAIWCNREYPLNEVRRDQAVAAACQAAGLGFNVLEGDLVLAPGQVVTGQGQMFQVFTPFARRWRQVLTSAAWQCLPAPKKQPAVAVVNDPIPTFGGGYRRDLWPAKPRQIAGRLAAFCDHSLVDYEVARDFPAHKGTALLSPYLALGAVSARQCLAEVEARHGPDGLAGQWLTELIWREFYRHLLYARPDISRGKSFKVAGDDVRWADSGLFERWCRGQTGVPIVDAGMRQLLRSGWMHNRLRMITAAFLSKLMLIDWHLGEAYFMSRLIDGDFASNNGGWQWSASVGADAAPYFRIFNPYRQAERFDPNGDFVRRFVPELASLTGKAIHQPSAEQCRQLGYPLPIIHYQLAREQALAVFAEAFKR